MKFVCNQSHRTSINSDSRVDPGVHFGLLECPQKQSSGFMGWLPGIVKSHQELPVH
jgi:hypothetical protein